MLMDYFISLKYKQKDLKKLNQCRIYTRVLSLADIMSADGVIIIPDCKMGRKLQDHQSALTWPTQERPTKSAWLLWSNALHHLEAFQLLRQPLRKWVAPSHQTWSWFIDAHSFCLYTQQPDHTWYYIDQLFESITTRAR